MGVALLVLWMGGTLLAPASLALGGASTEAPGHLWGLWTAADGVFTHGPWVRDAALGFPGHYRAHLMDPVNLPPFLLGYWILGGAAGATLGWNLVHVSAMVTALAGCVALRRVVIGDGPGAAGAGAVLAATILGGAFWMAHPLSGRTEFLPAAFYPGHLALLVLWLRGGRWWTGLGAGVLLGLGAAGGAYLATFLALLSLPTGLALLAVARDRADRLRRLLVVAVVAAGVFAPNLAAMLAWPPTSLSEMGSGDLLAIELTGERPLPSDAPQLGAILRLSERQDLAGALDQPATLGVAAVALLFAGLFARRAVGWSALTALAALVSLGPYARIGDGPVLRLPVDALVTALPWLQHLRSWERAAVLLSVPLGISAACGAAWLLGRVERSAPRALLAVLLTGAVLADQLTWPRVFSWPRPSFSAAAAPGLEEIAARLPAGAIVALPFELPGAAGEPHEPGYHALWQRQHGRPISATMTLQPDALLDNSPFGRFVADIQRRGTRAADDRALRCVAIAAAALDEQGFAAILLRRDRPGGAELEEALGRALGRPRYGAGVLRVWVPEELPATFPPAGGCPLPRSP